MDTIYVAYLKGGRKYIGHTRTSNFAKRKVEHYSGNGSKVTKKYKPYYIRAIKQVPHRYSKLEEIKLMRKFCKVYGEGKVSGGYKEHAFNF